MLHLENLIHHQLVKHSITWLRISLGLVFFGFGILKYFPGVSPAQNLTEATTHILFLGLIPGSVAIKMIATLECVIGICLLTKRGMRLAVWLLLLELIGILSPVVLLPGRLFAGPHHAPTLEGQYCLKDIILVAGAMVVTAGSFRGGRMIRIDLDPGIRFPSRAGQVSPEQRMRIVLEGMSSPENLTAMCDLHGITESDFHLWRTAALDGAHQALGGPLSATPDPVTMTDRGLDGARPAASVSSRALTVLAIALLGRR